MTETAPVPQVVLVGHCGPDEWMLRSAVERALPGVAIESVHDEESLQPHLSAGKVLLINRVLDGNFENTSGLDLLRMAVQKGPITLLISNFEDAQQSALDAGAHEGFGKAGVNHPKTTEILQAAVQT